VSNFAYSGGAVAVGAGYVRIAHCDFTGNRAYRFGGGLMAQATLSSVVDLLIEDSAFVNNRSHSEDGGAISAGLMGTAVRRCTFLDNLGDDGGAIIGRPVVEDSLFVGNRGNYGGALSGGGSYARCTFRNNHAGFIGGAFGTVLSGANNHATFIECRFLDNTTSSGAGGAVHGGLAYINCVFAGNRSGINQGGSSAPGGAIHTTISSVVTNCTFSGNASPGSGGAVSVAPGIATIINNCSFANNQANFPGQAVSGSAEICNSVFGQHPGGAPLAGVGPVSYSIVPAGSPLPAGVGNIIGDARFVNALGPDGVAGTEDDDLRLRADSPCIDAGDTTALPADVFDLDNDGDTTEPLPLDLHGNRRALQTPATPDTGVPPDPPLPPAIVDMGAIEYRRPADIAPEIGDGHVDVDDLIAVILGWGPCPAAPADCYADIDGDGEVGVGDLIAVILGWG
jgi:hypothetical protein